MKIQKLRQNSLDLCKEYNRLQTDIISRFSNREVMGFDSSEMIQSIVDNFSKYSTSSSSFADLGQNIIEWYRQHGENIDSNRLTYNAESAKFIADTVRSIEKIDENIDILNSSIKKLSNNVTFFNRLVFYFWECSAPLLVAMLALSFWQETLFSNHWATEVALNLASHFSR